MLKHAENLNHIGTNDSDIWRVEKLEDLLETQHIYKTVGCFKDGR